MSYTPNIPLNLDIDYAGMAADLRGQLYDGATQATVGGAISGVFFERPGAQAMYIMRPTIPNGHDGWCDIYVDGAPETVIGFFSINPAELENNDVKTSTRSTFAGGAVASVTGDVGGNVVGSIGSLATQAKADVNAEADTALADAGVTTTVTGRIDAAITTRATPANVTSAQTAITDAIDALHDITAADVVTALMSYSVESGKDYATVLKEVYAILSGKFVANAADPTSVEFYAPDGTTVRVTHTLTDTTRTPS